MAEIKLKMTFEERLHQLGAIIDQHLPNAAIIMPPLRDKSTSALLKMLVLLDVSRLRKHMFVTEKIIRKEVPHLLSTAAYPPHYPSFLNSEGMAGANPIVLTVPKIRYLVQETISGAPVTARFPVLQLILTDEFFYGLCGIQTMENFQQIVMMIYDEISTKALEKLATVYDIHPSGKTDARFGFTYFSIPVQLSQNAKIFINATKCSMPRPKPKTRKELLFKGEFTGGIYPTYYLHNLTYNCGVKDDVLKNLIYCSFFRLAINQAQSLTQYEAFHYHLKPGAKEKYTIRTFFEEDHIMTLGMYRLGRRVHLPVEYIERINYEFNAENYVKGMMAPLSTQSFLESFDGQALVRILESIPNFVYAFNSKQRALIASHHNTVVVGRSGTGKTTCAVMRMIGIRLLEIANANLKKGINKIRYQDLCESEISF